MQQSLLCLKFNVKCALQTLREAKEDADSRAKHEEEFQEARKAHFGAQFDDFQGTILWFLFSILTLD